MLGQGDDAMVSFVYPAGPGAPSQRRAQRRRAADPVPGLPRAKPDSERACTATNEGATRLEGVNVGREPGFWIAGVPHAFYVCPAPDECREERYRLAGNVLLWEQDGLTFRLESALTKEASLTIAESVRAPE